MMGGFETGDRQLKMSEQKEAKSSMRTLRRFLSDERGPELVEWAIVTVILVLATYLILQAIGDQLSAIYREILRVLGDILRPPAS
jgi:Flp pilus assembly pilin Flp